MCQVRYGEMHVDGRTYEWERTYRLSNRPAGGGGTLTHTYTALNVFLSTGSEIETDRPANESMSTVRTLYKTTPLYLISRSFIHSFIPTNFAFLFFQNDILHLVFIIINMLVKKIEYKFHNRMSMNIFWHFQPNSC